MLDVANAYYAMRIHMKLHERELREQQERKRYPLPASKPREKQKKVEKEVND